MQFVSRAAAVLALAPMALAVDWHFLTYYPVDGEQFIGFSGDMSVPTKPTGTYYLWPGLQPTDNSGVLQNVLDSRGSSWAIGSGWCCGNPSLPWGGSIYPPNGGSVHFDNVQGDGSWTCSLSTGDQSVTSNLAVGDKNMNQAVFAIEIYDATWTFGPLSFTNVVITSTGTDSSWCTGTPSNYNGATDYTITGVSSQVSGNTVICSIDSLVMNGPIGSP